MSSVSERYIKLRMSFQSKISGMSSHDLAELRAIVQNKEKEALAKSEKEAFAELLIDIEDAYEKTLIKEIKEQKEKSLISALGETLKVADKYKVTIFKNSLKPENRLISIIVKESESLFDQVNHQLFLEILGSNDGNRTKTAKELGISIRTVRNMANKLIAKGHCQSFLFGNLESFQ